MGKITPNKIISNRDAKQIFSETHNSNIEACVFEEVQSCTCSSAGNTGRFTYSW